MKKPDFLNKLFKKEKIKETEPNENIAKGYLKKSMKTLSSAKVLLEFGNHEDSLAMAYYAMYYSLLALLFRIGIKCENHAAAIILLKKVFDLDNSLIAKAKTERIDKQYYIDFSASQEETKKMIQLAENFTTNLNDFIERLNNEKVKQYHNKAMLLLK